MQYKLLCIVLLSQVCMILGSDNHGISKFIDLFCIGAVSDRILPFLDENIDKQQEALYVPSYIQNEQKSMMSACKSGNFTQFVDAQTMLYFYTSYFPQLQKYERVCNELQETPLHVALKYNIHYQNSTLKRLHDSGRDLILRRLLQENSGVNVQAVDAKGVQALHYAAYGRNIPVIKKLKKLGVNINAQDYEGNTAVHYLLQKAEDCSLSRDLIEKYFGDVLEAVCFLGADFSIKNKKQYRRGNEIIIGMTALEFAEFHGIRHTNLVYVIKQLSCVV